MKRLFGGIGEVISGVLGGLLAVVIVLVVLGAPVTTRTPPLAFWVYWLSLVWLWSRSGRFSVLTVSKKSKSLKESEEGNREG